MKKLFTKTLTIAETRALINEGYKFYVDCDFTTCGSTDPWSGMPDIDNNVAVFTDKAEAEAFAAEQVWPFNPNVHGKVDELCWGETWAEMDARLAREKAERKAKKDAKEAEKAAAAGMTVAEYKAAKAKAAKRARLEKEIAELEKEIAAKRTELAKVDA
jgi:Tfp pilus assembly protein FimV